MGYVASLYTEWGFVVVVPTALRMWFRHRSERQGHGLNMYGEDDTCLHAKQGPRSDPTAGFVLGFTSRVMAGGGPEGRLRRVVPWRVF